MVSSFVWYIAVFGITCVLAKLFSKKPNKVKFHFNFFIFYFVTSLVALVVWPFFLLRPRNVRNAIIPVQLIKHVTKVINVRWELHNGHFLSEDRGAVIVSNHQSSLDILGMFNIWHVLGNIAATAKKDLFYIWPFGLAAYLGGVVFIDRRNTKNGYKQLEITTELMVKNKTKIWLFPEGTRNKNSKRLLPFKKGAFVVAVSAQVPIIPVVYSPYYFVDENKYVFKKGHIIIKCLDPVPTTGLTLDDLPNLINEVHELMQTEYDKLRKEVLDALALEYPLIDN